MTDGTKWAPSRRPGEENTELPLREAVGQALGAASACWGNLAGAGVFDSTRCGDIFDWLMAYLGDRETRIRSGAAPPGPQ